MTVRNRTIARALVGLLIWRGALIFPAVRHLRAWLEYETRPPR